MSYKDPSPFLTVSSPTEDTNLLRVDTSFTTLSPSDLDTPSPSKSPSTGRARALSLAIPSLLTSSSSKDSPVPVTPVQEVDNRNVNAPLSRLRVEYRKLLRHVLQRLQERPKPSGLFTSPRNSSSGLPRASSEGSGLGGFVSISTGLGGGVGFESESEDEPGGPAGKGAARKVDDTEETCDRMFELREVLLGAELKGLHILSSGVNDEDPTAHRSSGLPFGRRRRSTLGNSDKPRPGFPGKEKADEGLQLFHQCIALLAELISNDCRFTITHFRPERPPNTLQSLCIDVAQCLLVSQKGEARAKGAYEVGLAMIPAFESFPGSMRGRLCGFFEGVLRGCLSDLKLVLAGRKKEVDGDPFEDRTFAFNAPQISIQVDDTTANPGGDSPDGTGNQLWSTEDTVKKSIVSSYAPDQPLAVYYLSSLTAPLLASILENIDMTSPSSDDDSFWVHRLFRTVVELKPDTYQDVLEIVAYGTSRARSAALSVLATFWPKALGHNVVCLPIPPWKSPEESASDILRGIQEPSQHPYAHEFLPWRFPPPPRRNTGASMTSLDEFARQATQRLAQTPCRACTRPVHDFGLLCPFCNSAVHFTCYDPPEGSTIAEYTTSTGVQKLAITRFSHILPSQRLHPPEPLKVAGHTFRWVNLFTLSLCFVCHEPIWGIAKQGVMCGSCRCCAHYDCASSLPPGNSSKCRFQTLSETAYSVEWSVLRRTFVTHYQPIVLTERELHNHSHETVSVIYCLLWLQLQLLNNGVAAGSLIIKQADPTTRSARANGVDEFELQYLTRLCDAVLQSDRLTKSDLLQEYRRSQDISLPSHALLFDPSFLAYITSLVKSRREKQDIDLSGSYLRPEMLTPSSPEEERQPYEITEIAHVHDVLSRELLVDVDFTAKQMLSYLQRLGLLERVDRNDNLLDGSSPARQLCMFPLPLALDFSSNVETLFTAIEACLSDVDLAVNEAGFALLRRCWPNGLSSAYAVERLVRVVLEWIMREERNLLTIARDYLSRQRLAPGIRSALETQPWPTATAVKSPAVAQGGTMAGGNDYMAFRRALLDKYAIPWLLKAHNLDTAAYSRTLHEHCLSSAAEETEASRMMNELFPAKDEAEAQPKIDVAFADATLRAFLKLCQVSVVFTAFDELFMFWLDEISNHGSDSPMVVRTLPRIFQAESDTARRSTLAGDIAVEQDINLSDLIDPWRSVTSVASEGVEGVGRSLRWVLVLAQSGVNIPEMTFRQIAGYARDFQAPLEVQFLLVHAIFASIWVRSLGRQDLATLVEILLERNEESLLRLLRQTSPARHAELFMRFSLAGLLALYGVDREKIVNSGLIRSEEHDALTSRRRIGGRLFGATERMPVSETFVAMLLRLSRSGTEATMSYAMNFLALLLADATLVSDGDLDLFIVANNEPICRMVWHSYAWSSSQLADLRIKCLLKALSVQGAFFASLLDEAFDPNQPWNSRLDSVGILFSLILELNNRDPELLTSMHRHHLSKLYSRFFELVWADEQELVRSAVETMSETLLPSHRYFIQSCWDSHFESSPPEDKAHFARFLLRLHPYFPTWSLISIRTIADMLGNDRTMYEDPTSIYDNIIDSPDLSGDELDLNLQAMLVSLTLSFVAHGIAIEPVDMLKMKVFLARVIGFERSFLRIAADGTCHVVFGELSMPDPAERGLFCLNAVKRVLDSPAKANISPSMLAIIVTPDTAAPCLIGTLLVDLIFATFRETAELSSLPHLVLRCWLESLIILILKHDMRSAVLKHLDADLRSTVLRTTEIFLMDTPYDNRQLALTVNRCYLKKFSSDKAFASVLPRQINATADLLAALNFNPEDILVAQGKALLAATISRFPKRGLFVLLMKNGSISDNVLKALSATLKDCNADGLDGFQLALRDIITTAFQDRTHSELNWIITNLPRFMEAVCIDRLPIHLLTDFGFFVANLAKQTSEWPSEDFNGDAVVSVVCTVSERDPASSRELLVQTEIYIRTVLLRFDVRTSTLRRLLETAKTVVSQSQKTSPAANEPFLAIAIIECLRDAMMVKPRPTLFTVHSMLEIAWDLSVQGPTLHFSVPDRLAADCLTYLQSFHTTGATSIQGNLAVLSSELAFTTCIEASKIFLLGLPSQREALRAAFGTGAGQAMASRAGQVLRVWAFLALAALSVQKEPSNLGQQTNASLGQHLADYQFTFATLMRVLLENIREETNNSTDLSYGHASLLLWLLLAQSTDPRGVQESGLWHGIWPSLEQLIIKSHGLEGGGLMAAAQQLSDIFVDVVMFLLRSNSAIPVKYAATFSGLLSAMKEVNTRAQSKIAKCLQALNQPPIRATREELLFEAQTALLANEKLTSALMSEYTRNTIPRHPRGGRTT